MDRIVEGLQPLAVDISTLKTLEGNPRKGDVAAVARSYERFGQRKPIVAKRDGTIIAGNHQYAAALSLGWDRIAVVVVDDDESTAKAFALADNQTSDLAVNDEMALAQFIQDLQEEADESLLAATGFDEDDIDRLLAKLSDPSGGEAPGSKGLGEPVVSYNIVFDSEEQQQRWFALVRWLKINVEGDTVAERLDRYLSGLERP